MNTQFSRVKSERAVLFLEIGLWRVLRPMCLHDFVADILHLLTHQHCGREMCRVLRWAPRGRQVKGSQLPGPQWVYS